MKTFPKIQAPMLAVPESQSEKYMHLYDANMIIIPDGHMTNIGKWCNYVLNAIDDPHIVIMSDDINLLGYWEGGQRILFDAPGFSDFLSHGFDIAESLGVKLWGINSGADSMRYRTYAPFHLLAPIAKNVACHISPELRYDESMGHAAHEDFWLRNIQKYHRVLRMNKYHYTSSSIVQDGEWADISRLQARWGSVVEVARMRQGRGEKISLKYKIPIDGL